MRARRSSTHTNLSHKGLLSALTAASGYAARHLSTHTRHSNPLHVYGQTYTKHTLRKDVLAGIATALVCIPLTIGIAIVSGYPIQVGLYTVVCACLVGFICSLFRPGNYNGVAGISAGLAPMLALGVHTFGLANMPFIVFLTAIIQIVIWRYMAQSLLPRYM